MVVRGSHFCAGSLILFAMKSPGMIRDNLLIRATRTNSLQAIVYWQAERSAAVISTNTECGAMKSAFSLGILQVPVVYSKHTSLAEKVLKMGNLLKCPRCGCIAHDFGDDCALQSAVPPVRPADHRNAERNPSPAGSNRHVRD